MKEEIVGKRVLDAAFKVHSILGPGLLESVYEAALAHKLELRGLNVERQKPIAVLYAGLQLEVGYRADIIIDGLVFVELKSVETVTLLFQKIVLNYLRLIPLRLGYLINFNVDRLKDGLQRIVNRYDGKGIFGAPTLSPKLKNRASQSSHPSLSSCEIPYER